MADALGVGHVVCSSHFVCDGARLFARGAGTEDALSFATRLALNNNTIQDLFQTQVDIELPEEDPALSKEDAK